MQKSTLKMLLSSVEIISPAKTCFEEPEVKPYLFCPECGCRGVVGTGNMTQYPEHWEHFHCVRCHKVVGQIDNSPLYHILEFSDNNYEFD